MIESDFFSLVFKALTGNEPLRWQERLYKQMQAGNLPVTCDLPTGLGKTSVIPIWLIAFAEQIDAGQTSQLPRRLIYIVNRRTVVDQATVIAEQLRRRIIEREAVASPAIETLDRLREALARSRANPTSELIAISTLRGELADNEEWKTDPARLAIIIGTVDMIGSKLLFSGYGDGFRKRPHHAGLVGQDALIIHDEAHLTPAFSALLRGITEEQQKSKEPRPVHVLELSATTSSTTNGLVLSLEPEDEGDDVVRDRLNAQKLLWFCETEDPVKRIVELAWEHQDKACKVLIYVNSPETAQATASKLEKQLDRQSKERVALLTGTIRGYERDWLVKDHPVYRALLQHGSRVEQSVYLVSTSAGEVGIDLDADHMVCDLTTLDRMIQRLGRVNRRGGLGRVARVDVVVETGKKGKDGGKKEKDPTSSEPAKLNTRVVLEKLPAHESDGYDASPAALRKLLKEMNDTEKRQAFAPPPPIVPLTDILLDAWALTSVREVLPGRPEVAPYLHGLTTDPPETYVAWRSEIKLLAKANAHEQVLRDWFRRCRVEAQERLRDRTKRIQEELQKIAKRYGDQALPVVVLTERGEAKLLTLQKLLDGGFSALAYRTVMLPTEAGGLTKDGFLDGNVKEIAIDIDVAEADGKRTREIFRSVGDTYWHWPIGDYKLGKNDSYTFDSGETFHSIETAAAQVAQACSKVVSYQIPLVSPSEGGEYETESRYLFLLIEPKQAAEETPESCGFMAPPTLEEHSQQAAAWAERIADALDLEELLKQVLITQDLRLGAENSILRR